MKRELGSVKVVLTLLFHEVLRCLVRLVRERLEVDTRCTRVLLGTLDKEALPEKAKIEVLLFDEDVVDEAEVVELRTEGELLDIVVGANDEMVERLEDGTSGLDEGGL